MAREFEPDRVMELGWHKGAILDRLLAVLAWNHASNRLHADEQDNLAVTSDDCDILNVRLAKEVVEVLRARVPDAPAGQRGYHSANAAKTLTPTLTIR